MAKARPNPKPAQRGGPSKHAFEAIGGIMVESCFKCGNPRHHHKHFGATHCNCIEHRAKPRDI